MGSHAVGLTLSSQDYLKHIYELTEEGEPAGTNALAARLKVSPASVTGMLRKLSSAAPALVIYRKHQGATLTAAGRRAALEVIRHHRLLEAWLVESLGYTWDEVHADAERLEHAVSEDMEKRIARALGDPRRDPHGEPIPLPDLTMPRDASVALSDLLPGQEGVVQRVAADDPALLRHFDDLGLHLGVKVRMLGKSALDGVIALRLADVPTQIVLGPAIAGRVFVGLTEAKHANQKSRKRK